MGNNIQQNFLNYCGTGNFIEVKELLKDPNVDPSYNNYAIRYASYRGHIGVVKELLKDPRVDPSGNYNYAIRYSSMNGHVDVVRDLLKDPRIDKQELLNSDITNELRNEILDYLTEVRGESINKVLDIDI